LSPKRSPLLRRRQLVLDCEVALEDLLRLAAYQADEVVGRMDRRTGTGGSCFSSAGGSGSTPALLTPPATAVMSPGNSAEAMFVGDVRSDDLSVSWAMPFWGS
jgi:hypothetical protein